MTSGPTTTMGRVPALLMLSVMAAGAANTARNQTVSPVQCVHKHVAGVHKITIAHGGQDRAFLLLVPNGLPTDKLSPVVVDVPGFSESPYYQVELTAIMQYLEVFKWTAVVPFGTATNPTSTCCPASSSAADCEAGKTLDKSNPCSFNAGSCCGVAVNRRVDDVGFARTMAQYVHREMCGDPEAVFATGFSNGAMMSNRLGCQAADLFRAVAPVAGNVRLNPLDGFGSCAPSKPVGWLSFCGTRDSACNANFEETAADWAKHNRCAEADPLPTYVTSTTACYKYQGCQADTEFCILDDLGHEWPGHVRPDGTSQPQPRTNVDATAYIFEKFAESLRN